jgi:hypothetical protein
MRCSPISFAIDACNANINAHKLSRQKLIVSDHCLVTHLGFHIGLG